MTTEGDHYNKNKKGYHTLFSKLGLELNEGNIRRKSADTELSIETKDDHAADKKMSIETKSDYTSDIEKTIRQINAAQQDNQPKSSLTSSTSPSFFTSTLSPTNRNSGLNLNPKEPSQQENAAAAASPSTNSSPNLSLKKNTL